MGCRQELVSHPIHHGISSRGEGAASVAVTSTWQLFLCHSLLLFSYTT